MPNTQSIALKHIYLANQVKSQLLAKLQTESILFISYIGFQIGYPICKQSIFNTSLLSSFCPKPHTTATPLL